MIIKAITVRHPYAQYIRDNLKKIETRKWTTSYRGKLLIHCAKLPKCKYSGMAIAICDLVDIKPMTKEHEKDAWCGLYDGANSFFLENIQPIEPVPIRGKLSLWNVEVELK